MSAFQYVTEILKYSGLWVWTKTDGTLEKSSK